jgi:hypothetical protein
MLASVALIGFGVPTAMADVIEFEEDKEGWEAAVGEFTTIDFTEYPSGTWVFEQYSHLGVHFVDGADIIQCCSFELYPEDGAGLDGNAEVRITFDEPISYIAADYPGILFFRLYSGGELSYSSDWLGGSGPGHFGGFVSDHGFDEIRIIDPVGGNVNIDNIYFGPPIPGPGVVIVLAAGALTCARGRRR